MDISDIKRIFKLGGMFMGRLPFSEPYISTIPEQSNMMAIVGRGSGNWCWFLNYYIQLKVNKNVKGSLNLNFCYGENYKLIKDNPILETYSIPRRALEIFGDICSFFRRMIDEGFYVYLTVDRYEISPYEEYHRKHRNHDMLIWGYEGDIFFVADFFGVKYSAAVCTTEELEKGYKGYDTIRDNIGFEYIFFMKTRENFQYTFNVKLVKELLQEYLDGENSNKHFHPLQNPSYYSEGAFDYGISIYSKIEEYLDLHRGEELQIRSFQLLYEHKKMLAALIRYLGEEMYLQNSESYIKQVNEVVEKTLILRNMVLKYVLLSEERYLNEMQKMIKEICGKEVALLASVISDIHLEPRNIICENTTSTGIGTNIVFQGKWKRLEDGEIETVDKEDKAFYVFRGNEVVINFQPENYARKICVWCDGKCYTYEIPEATSQIKIGNLKYTYHNIVIENGFSYKFAVKYLQCRTLMKYAEENVGVFVGLDLETKGNWEKYYGRDGYDIFAYNNTLPHYVRIVYSGMKDRTWKLDPDNNVGQVLKVGVEKEIVACRFFEKRATIDLVIADEKTHMVSLYIMDCYQFHRKICIEVMDGDMGQRLSREIVEVKNDGIYVRYRVKGHIIFELENIGNSIGVVSAVFLD